MKQLQAWILEEIKKTSEENACSTGQARAFVNGWIFALQKVLDEIGNENKHRRKRR